REAQIVRLAPHHFAAASQHGGAAAPLPDVAAVRSRVGMESAADRARNSDELLGAREPFSDRRGDQMRQLRSPSRPKAVGRRFEMAEGGSGERDDDSRDP